MDSVIEMELYPLFDFTLGRAQIRQSFTRPGVWMEYGVYGCVSTEHAHTYMLVGTKAPEMHDGHIPPLGTHVRALVVALVVTKGTVGGRGKMIR